jgi:alkyl sulfatase BDS1-like metallo-beta-lactamase superfamily hydrolase
MHRLRVLCLVPTFIAACGDDSAVLTREDGERTPSAATVAAQAEVAEELDLGDPVDFEDAERGLVSRDPELRILRDDGHVVWEAAANDFIDGPAPPSVNPSLWRQAKLNKLHGLYRVTDGIYQVRGYDISNLTLIRGRTGWIVVDTLTSRETAAAAMALARKHLGPAPVTAIVFTHSHVDHFGGIDGVLTESERANVPIVAPKGFLEEATSENVLAGIAMGRRAGFMFGIHLERSPTGHVDTGLGQAPARGTIAIAKPTHEIDRTPQEMSLDGVRFVFQFTPESEAPAEMTFYLPDHRAFCGAEIVSRTQHNLYTLRGAKVRDALAWSGYIDQALHLFGDADLLFASHGWPTWGNERVVDHLKKQRDTYKYIHDQTLRLASSGATPREIAEELELPSTLRSTFASRGYYGAVSHNSRAVYDWYFGWFDGNPAELDPLPPEAEAKKYLDAMGGLDAVLAKAEQALSNAEYRWAATLLNHAVFAAPADERAKILLARAYDQLGYRAESGPWRDFYLTGAHELRHGPAGTAIDLARSSGLLRNVPTERFLDAIATRLNGPSAGGKLLKVNLVFTDAGESFLLTVENAVLHHERREPDPTADATLRLTKELFFRILGRQVGLREMIFSDELDVDGSRLALLSFFSLLETPDETFAIVTP